MGTVEGRQAGRLELVIRHVDDGIEIVQADPVVRISADLLQRISIETERGEALYAWLVGDVLTIQGVNRTVVYRVDYSDWRASDDTYRMEWPD